MRHLVLTAVLSAIALPAAAQQNPFKLPKARIGSAAVTYSLTGDNAGSATLAFDGDRMARRQTSTMKMMGKTTNTAEWTLTTPDSTWRANLTKKTGTVAPNLLPFMAKAYDDLNGAGKKRLHQNMEDMASMLSQGFGLANINSGEKLGTRSYAGQECQEKKFGSFTVCTMTKAPIMLHTQGSLICFNFEETATEVRLGSAPGDAFAPPPGITFQPDRHLEHPDSMAKGFVGYLASQQLADSIAKGKAELAAAKAKQEQAGQPTKLTPEQEAQMQKGCEMLKNFDLGKAISDATDQLMKEMADAAKRAAVDAAKNAATSKINGFFKKIRIP